MADIDYSPYGFVTPTSWGDHEMDWGNPDGRNPAYMSALWEAYTERMLMGGVGSYYDSGDTHRFPQWRSQGARPYSAAWANNLAERILGLASAYVTINTDALTKRATPYITVLSQIQADDQLADMSISPGDLLGSSRTTAFLKACKHFLDMMTITTVHSKEQYESGGYDPYLFKYDLWVADASTDAFDDYDPYNSSGWSAHWDACVSRKVVEYDFDGTFPSSYFTGYSYKGYLTVPVNVVYQSRTPLAHNLIMQFAGDTSDPGPGDWQYERPWDWLGLGLANGDLYTVAAPAGGGEVAIGGSVAVAPTNTPSYAGWDGTPPEPDPLPPSYHSVFFRGRFGSFAFDYGVAGGFSF